MQRALLVLMTALAAAGAARAQYDDPREYEPSLLRVVNLGVWSRDFAPRPSNPTADSAVIRYNRLMPLLGFRNGPVDLTFGFASFTQPGSGGGSRSTLFLGATYATDVVLSGRRSSALVLPLLFAVDYTKAEAGGPAGNSFNIASMGIGTGLKYRLAGRAVEFTAMAGGIAHLAINAVWQPNARTGFSGAVVADAAVLVRDLGVGEGLVLGWRFRLQTWSLSESRFNYRALSHGPYLGVAF